MKSLIEYLVKSIVQHPKDISLETHKEDDLTIYHLTTNPEDLGKVIGKKGKTIKSLRNLIYLKSLLEGKKARLYLEEGN